LFGRKEPYNKVPSLIIRSLFLFSSISKKSTICSFFRRKKERTGQEASFPLFQKNYVFLLGVGFLFFGEKKAEEGKEIEEKRTE
jgi:hypothetical protein